MNSKLNTRMNLKVQEEKNPEVQAQYKAKVKNLDKYRM